MMHEALHDVTHEERRLREYISVTKVALDAAYGEAVVVATQAELAGVQSAS